MEIHSLSLKQYRNIAEEKITFSPGVNILTGDNAQGKTNIMEALWLFSAFKSFRNASDKDFIQYDKEFARLDVSFEKEEKEQTGTLKYYADKKRVIFLNGIKRTPSEAIGTVLSVMFFPEHLNLVKEGPEERRRFIDFAVCQVKPIGFKWLSLYKKTLFQRNTLLKSDDPALKETLDVWDEKLSAYGAQVCLLRREYIKALQTYALPVMNEISDGKETMALRYETFCEEEDLQKTQEILYEKLVKSREKDFMTGFTGVGPHKDNLEILLNGRSARVFASQGQQRSCVMALKLAETEIVKDTYGEYPVLLFDDVFSELDKNRKEYIIGKIKNKQVIITSCEDLHDFGGANVLTVKNGTVVKR